MKKINNLLLAAGIIVASVAVSSCKKTQTTSDGIEYTYISEGKDATKDGEYVLYNFVAKNSKDSIFISSYDQPIPPYLQHQDGAEAQSGIDEIFLNLKKGDSIRVVSKANKIFGPNLPPFLDSAENVTIEIGVVNVIEEAVFQDYYNDLMAAQQKKQEENAKQQLQDDIETIEKYIAENNLQATKTESGLFYVIEKDGTGAQVEQGNTISVDYTGYVLDGTVFDTSVESRAKESNTFAEGREYVPISFPVGQGRVIQGWDEGLQLLKKGSVAKLLIPSPLAYGPSQRSEVIQANSILVFDVEVTDVQK
jgi:FKBP-type peptidyl-prolyl cis-trans isomerase FkpA